MKRHFNLPMVRVNLRNTFTLLDCYIGPEIRINEKYRFSRKCEKIKKDSKNHNSKNIDPTDLWLAPFERKKLALY